MKNAGRLRALIQFGNDDIQYTAKKLADETHIDRERLANILDGKCEATKEELSNIAKAFDFQDFYFSRENEFFESIFLNFEKEYAAFEGQEKAKILDPKWSEVIKYAKRLKKYR